MKSYFIISTLAALLLSVSSQATEITISGGVYSPTFDSSITKRGYIISGSASLKEINKNISVIGTLGYAKTGREVDGRYASDLFGGIGVRGIYQISPRLFVSGELGVDYHDATVRGFNDAIINQANKIGYYGKVGIDYALSRTTMIGVDYRKNLGTAEAESYGITFKSLF